MLRITVVHLLKRNLARNAANICKAPKSSNVFDKGINLFVLENRKHGKPSQENGTENDLDISEETSKEKMSEEELGPAISNQLAEMAIKYWSEESKNPVVVIKIFGGL